MMNMKKAKTKRIVAAVIAVILILAMIVPTIAAALM